jgi:hypothetical protein
MKILILVLSYTEWPFDKFMEVQQSTWNSRKHPDIEVIYYHGRGKWWDGVELALNCSDDYNMMHWKFKLALDFITYHQFDFIFRTNSCSYIVKEKLLEVAKTLPLTKCYAGYQNGDYISGAGIFFSPDVLDILKAELTDEPHGAEDVLIGSILKDRVPMINDESRIDAEVSGFNKFGSYHYRAKTSNDNEQRQMDIDNLRKLHEHLTNK